MNKPIPAEVPVREVCNRLRLIRMSRGFSLVELHKLSGVSKVYIHKLEKAENPNLTITFLQKLAEALKIHTASLLLPTRSERVVIALDLATRVMALSDKNLDKVEALLKKIEAEQ